MIDYTSKEVRAKLYREREDISEFGIDDIHNLTCHMFHSFQLRRAVNLKNEAECVLDSFNNAFYILTIIQKEKRPEQFMGQYIEIAQSIPTDNVKYKNQFTVLTIAMVINILQVLDEKYQSEYNIVHARFKDNIKWLCEQIPSIDTYELFLKEIIPKSYIKDSPNLYRVNPDDFIPLAELPKNEKNDKSGQNEEPGEEIQWHDKVRLELALRLLEKDGLNWQKVVKVRVAELLQTLTGLPLQTCKNYCSNRYLNTEVHKDEVLKLNSKLQAIGSSILL